MDIKSLLTSIGLGTTKRDMATGGVGVAAAVLISWIITITSGVSVPTEVSGAIGAVIMWVCHEIDKAIG